jgi:2-polyprenyl-3-methyl-5-hydroxy-6-metoxy-1,4-benzoquinol methylase
MLKSPEWPEAVPEFLICEDNDEDKFERAEGIMDYVGVNFLDKKVLDFGCGEGHVALKVAESAKFVVGFDIVAPIKSSNEKCLLTNDFEQVLKNGPYDVVILYDVLDHSENPVELLKKLQDVCDKDSMVFVRCHSWTSRHGGHLYRQLNKAYVHLFFTKEELERIGVKTEFVQEYYYPLLTQKKWFEDSSFSTASEDIVKTFVESFFRKKELHDILSLNYENQFPEWQMSQSFNDYVLRLN